ncbi:MAG: adenosylcobinamide amidohydrolase [Candidatus Rokubacteria bacterium]|nr:adenosylcobinamide amidohydrolase [Candidatus Rokubacteria bacterium]
MAGPRDTDRRCSRRARPGCEGVRAGRRRRRAVEPAGGGHGRPPAPPDSAGTVNMIVVVDGDPGPAALLNAMLAGTEARALALFEAGVVCDGGSRATGTSTDAVVIAATGQGAAHEFGGPATEPGWCVARAAREALVPAIARWKAEHA